MARPLQPPDTRSSSAPPSAPARWPAFVVALAGAAALGSIAAGPFDIVILPIAMTLNLFLVYGPRTWGGPAVTASDRSPPALRIREYTAAAIVALLLTPLESTRPGAAVLTAVFAAYVVVLMLRSRDPWMVPAVPVLRSERRAARDGTDASARRDP